MALRFPVELARQWVKTVHHNGLIRFYVTGNRERILVLSPKGISDLMVSRSYDFERSEIARIQLGAVTGEGLLLAEGDVHKVRMLQDFDCFATNMTRPNAKVSCRLSPTVISKTCIPSSGARLCR